MVSSNNGVSLKAKLASWSWRCGRLVLVGVLFGWLYAWGAPRFYSSQQPGFAYGMVHGALMPMALPSLLLGKDVTIYAAQNTGRTYKLGYITGINVCGFVFFGLAFLRPPKRDARRLEDS